MVFSSFSFIFVFLPIVLAIYYLVKDKYKNVCICIASLIFYAWGEPKNILLMLISVILNYFLAIWIGNTKGTKKKVLLIIDIILNIMIIGFFKYANFLIDNINYILHTNIGNVEVALPIGISFYTFQILSYVIDVYRGNVKVQKNIIKLCTYISLFPQLIAGPIVRYEDIEKQLDDRKESFDKFIKGLKRFIYGLGKKVLLANNMALIADTIYETNPNNGTIMLWLAAISYTLQIYFDFSGYSDMAIGLGKMFGFKFMENFNYPYIAKSVTDFWRRWHISLSTWFKDYVYIPLGGNRVSQLKLVRNILIVWGLTGLWHGANWNFIIWGFYYAILLIIEKLVLNKWLDKLPKVVKHIYSLLIIVIGWVIFRTEDLSQIFIIVKNMFIYNPSNIVEYVLESWNIKVGLLFIIPAIILSTPVISKKIKENLNKTSVYVLNNIIVCIIFGLSIIQLLIQTYNPFIYFNF